MINHDELKQIINNNKGYIRIKAMPNSAKTEFRQILEDNTIKISINKSPERNKANQELIAFLAKYFKIKKTDVIILSGFTDQLKLIRLNNFTSIEN
jgi:uncharacterized protein (TIGR00251 family)